MYYVNFQGLELSALGLGTMRLPVVNDDPAQIDQAVTDEMVSYALDHGINYFDTAWGYHNGQSEIATGRALARHPRDSFYLATKFPGYDLANMDRAREIFPRQLEKTGTDHVDFYLIHNVNEANIDEYLNPAHGIVPYLLEQKSAGRIRHLGFSAHGSIATMERFLDAYGEHMEFCQLQINYLDWVLQDARGKVEQMRRHGLPVWVMEPVRGGKLAALSDADRAVLAEANPALEPAAWALRFVQGIDDVAVTLSGMSNFEQLRQNIETFEERRPLSDAEATALAAVRDRMLAQDTVPCTACRYCTEYCPQGLDIPDLLAHYNDCIVSKGGFVPKMYANNLPAGKRPSACIGCGSCAAVCPQQIDIPGALAAYAAAVEEGLGPHRPGGAAAHGIEPGTGPTA